MLVLLVFEHGADERQHIHYQVTEAKTLDEAEQKAMKHMSDYFGEGTVKHPEFNTIYYSDDGSEYIELSRVEPITVEQLIKQLSI